MEDVKVPDKVKKRLNKYQTRFQKANDAVQTKHRDWAELDKFDRGEQWDNIPVPPWIPKPVANHIRYIRTLKRANLTGNVPHSVFSPEYYEDTAMVEKIQKAYMHVWDRKRVSRVVRRVVDRAILLGTGVAYVYEDDTYVGGKYYGSLNAEDEDYSQEAVNNSLYQGDICVKNFPVTNFFPDPDAWRIEDCKFIETTEMLSLNQIKNSPKYREYAEAKKYQLDKIEGSLLDKDAGANGDVYERDAKPSDDLRTIDSDGMVTLHTHWERYLNEEGKWQLDVTQYIKGVPFELFREEDVKPSEYPFVVYYDEEEEQDFWGMSIAMDILSLQKVINKTAQTSSIIATLHQNPQKIVTRESGINAQEMARTGTLPGKVWVSNVPGEQAVHVIKPADIPRGLFETEDRMKSDIREVAGINEAYTGDSIGSLTTSTGVQELIERATVRDRDKMSQIDEFVEKLSNLIVQFILHKWDTPRRVTNRKLDGSIESDTWQPLTEMEINNLDWRVKSDVYSVSPVTQASRRQQADKLLTLQGQHQFQPAIITSEEYIKIFGFDDGEQILQRMAKDRQVLQQQQLQQAQQAPIPPLAGFNISLSSKDPNAIYNYLEQAKQQGIDIATLNVQTQQELDKAHGLIQQVAQANAPKESQGNQGNASPVAQANMTIGS